MSSKDLLRFLSKPAKYVTLDPYVFRSMCCVSADPIVCLTLNEIRDMLTLAPFIGPDSTALKIDRSAPDLSPRDLLQFYLYVGSLVC